MLIMGKYQAEFDACQSVGHQGTATQKVEFDQVQRSSKNIMHIHTVLEKRIFSKYKSDRLPVQYIFKPCQ